VFSKATSSLYTNWQYGIIYAGTWRTYVCITDPAGLVIHSIAATQNQKNSVMAVCKASGDNTIINTGKAEVTSNIVFAMTEKVGFRIGNNGSKFIGEIKSLLIFNTDVYSKYTNFVNGGI